MGYHGVHGDLSIIECEYSKYVIFVETDHEMTRRTQLDVYLSTTSLLPKCMIQLHRGEAMKIGI